MSRVYAQTEPPVHRLAGQRALVLGDPAAAYLAPLEGSEVLRLDRGRVEMYHRRGKRE